MPAEEHEEPSVLSYALEKVLGPALDGTYAPWVERLHETNPGLAKFMGYDGFVHHGHVMLPDHIVMLLVALLLMMVLVPIIRGKLSLDAPSHAQQVGEVVVQTFINLLNDVVGHHSRRFLPVIGTFGLLIFVSNFMGMLPGLHAPTANLNVTFALGLCSFLFYNAQGFKEQGVVKYLAHFWGPIMWMGPLMFVIEIFSHMFRHISLAIRLYGNMNGEHILGNVFLESLTRYPLLIPVPVMALGLFTVLLQSYIFVMLSMVYIAGAVAHEH